MMIELLLLIALNPKAIESHYNSTPTLSLDFTQTYQASGRKRVESGRLVLRKPGRMRWEYDNGNVFVTDGKMIWFYQPSANRAEYSKVKESEDLRAPLAFLLGKLDFKKLFKEVREEGEEIVGIPKSDKAPYREVRFIASSSGIIDHVKVTGQDSSVMEFSFRNQQRNVNIQNDQFRFTPPPGTQVLEASEDSTQ